ncbi:MAG: glycosyltransferase family 4 protein [Propionibacteriales bacterium]|nr:glycosyltransferase family 4 protein [Propionibacteriales bacterium]
MKRESQPARSTAPSNVVVLNWRDPWHPEGGGSELYVHQIARQLRDSGTSVTWVTAAYPDAARDEVVDGIRFIRRGGHLTVYLWVAVLLLTGALKRRLGRLDAVLEVQNGMPFLASWLTGARVVVLVHHVHREQWNIVGPVLARVGWFLESRVAVRANRGRRYVAVSDMTRRELVDLGVRANDIALAYNGMPPVPEYHAGTRHPDPTLIVLSRLVPHKQIDHVITAMPALAEEFPNLRLRVLGDGWWREELQEQVAQLAETTGVDYDIDFLGHVSDRTKFEELSRAWVHVLPSVKEGWGLSIVEAGYAGTPSVAYSSAGGVTESILDGVSGLLAADQPDLTAQIAAILRSPLLREELGHKAQVHANEFTWEAAAATIGAALEA